MRACPTACTALLFLLSTAVAGWAEHPSLAKARVLYNEANYDAAIAAADVARTDAESADAAALVWGRSLLERYRLRADPADLAAAREALSGIAVAALTPRDRVDLLVGIGQSLYLGDTFGPAAELFDTALSGASMLPERDRLRLLDWWASALDREAQERPAGDRRPLFNHILARMEDAVREDPANPVANYWLPVAARGAGDIDRAWDAAVAGWVRAALSPDTEATLRADLDRFVTEALIPERIRPLPAAEQEAAQVALAAEWRLIKEQWQ